MRFSNRQIEGLPLPPEQIIVDLSSYIKIFSNGRYKDYLFRGEPTNYDETSASGLRGDSTDSLIRMKEDFKREVWHKLSQDERIHFTAFCQHHGIPTNLIDISTSPLIALFFACQPFNNRNEKRFDEQRGFVYFFKDTAVDISDIVEKYENDNILDLIENNTGDIILDIYKLILDFERKDTEKLLIKLKHLMNQQVLNSNEDVPDFFKYIDLDYVNFDYVEYRYQFDNDLKAIIYKEIENKYNKSIYDKIEQAHKPISPLSFYYVLKLYSLMSNRIFNDVLASKLDFLPDFKYAPILAFERGRSQQGLFYYQLYSIYDNFIYGTNRFLQQRIWPDEVIVIENKEAILKELDFIGINNKTVYGDFDNIAQYIKNKYI